MKKTIKAAASGFLTSIFIFMNMASAIAAPNAEATLWKSFVPGENGVDGAYIQRLGHTPDGTPYMVFVQSYSPSVGPAETHWASADTEGSHWLEITFSAEKTINRINLYFFENNTNKYPWESFTISYKKDGEWQPLLTKEGNTDMIMRYSFCGVGTTAVRVDITDPSTAGTDKYARLREIEIFDDTGKNVACYANGGAITADSRANSNRSPEYAIDGYSQPELGYWSPAAKTAAPHWLMVDMGEVKEFNEIKIAELDDTTEGKQSGFVDYQLQYNAGTNANPVWVDVAKVTGNLRASAFASFDTVSARQVRIYITKTRSGDVPKITGFRVYNRAVSNENIAADAKLYASSHNKAMGGLVNFGNIENFSQQISCISAYDLSGNLLWQKGTPSVGNRTIGSDLPIQIYDIDNDGEEEIITVYNDRLQILSYNGEIEKEVSLYLQADSLMPLNVRGTETKQDILVKDRYKEIAVYDNNLNLLWSRYQTNTAEDNYSDLYGHFPYPCDVDNDGKDEILAGAVLLDDDGTLLHRYITDGTFVNPKGETHIEIAEHSDGMKIADIDPEHEGLEMVSAYSSAGTMFMDTSGNRLTTDTTVGHAQKIVVGQFAPTVPGLEVFTSTKPSVTDGYQLYLNRGNGAKLWENPIDYGKTAKVIQMDPSSFIKAGSGQEHLLIAYAGGIFDNEYNCAVALPSGSVKRFGYSVNIGGDDREELLMWNEGKVQIWTNTAAVPDGGKNIARDATISVDSTFDENYNVSALNDGYREGSVWKSADAEGEHCITVDFGSQKTFDELWIYGYSNSSETYFPQNFKIQYNSGSVSAPVWTTIHNVVNNQKGSAAYTFDAVTAQQVRILITDPTTALTDIDNAARICEIEIYEALTDGFTAVSGIEADNTLTFDSVRVIDGVQLDFEGTVKDFSLEYLNNGVWTELASALCNTKSQCKYAFSPVSASAIRAVVTDGDGSVSISAREYSGYEYENVVNELIVNPTKSGNTGSYRWTNY